MKSIIDRIFSIKALLSLLLVFAASGAWAAVPVPTVVWESGEFDSSKTGTDGQTYSISRNNLHTINGSGNIVIGEGAQGVTINLPSNPSDSVSVLVKYSSTTTAPVANAALATIYMSAQYDIGAIVGTSGSSSVNGYYSSASKTEPQKADYSFSNGLTLSQGSGVMLLSHGIDTGSTVRGTAFYTGATVSSMTAGGNVDALQWKHSSNNKRTISTIAIGGPTRNNVGVNAWNGMVIEKIAVFVNGYYTGTQLADYRWPSDVAADLKKWIDDSRTIYAWRGGANFHEGSIGAVSPDGTIAAGTTVTYTEFGADCPAPGHVLYYDAAGYTANTDAQFTPFAIGGLCVKSAADSSGTPYTVCGYNSKDTNRQTWLGAAGYETYFEFDESFVFARTNGVSQIAGTVNLSVAAGKEFDLNSQVGAKSAAQLASGAVLKMSGEGNLKVHSIDAIDGTLDFSALSGRSAALPFINGTVMLGANTVFKLPAGAVSPYKIGTAVTGTMPSAITIGDKTYAPVTVTAGTEENAGAILWSVNEATISEAGDYSLVSDAIFPTVTADTDYFVAVNADAALNVGTSTARAITFNVAEGKTLTLSGTSLTATTICITGKGVVKVTAGGALKGTVTGDGTLLYTKSTSEATNVIPTIGSAGISLAPSWNGTLWLKDITGSSYNGNVGGNRVSTGLPDMANYGVSGSKVKFTNVHAWCNNISVPWTLVLEDGESEGEVAWENDNGSTGNKTVGITIAALEGDGTFCDNYDSCYPYLKFTSVENFRGSIVSKGKRILLGNATIGSAGAGSRGSFTVGSDITATIAAGKKWSSGGVFTINGNITNNGTIETTGTGTGSNAGKARPDTDSNNYSQVPNVVVSGVLTNAGTITIPSVASVSVSGTANYAASVSGATTVNGGTLNVMANTSGAITVNNGGVVNTSGTISLSGANVVNVGGTLNVENGNATLTTGDRGISGTVNIGDGATLTANTGDSMNYNSDGSGTINVYGTLDFDTKRWTLGPNTVVNLYEDAIVQGTGDSGNDNAALDFNVDGGSTIHALGNATISCTIRNNAANGTAKINVDAGKTLTFSGNLVGSYGLKKQGGGILKLTGSIEKLPTIEAGTVLLGGNKEWNLGTLRDLSGYTLEAGSSIAITQTMAEYGSGVTTVTGIDSSIASITVNKLDGTTTTITPTAGTATLVESVVVSGAACWYDFTFTNTITTASGSSAGTVTLGKDAGPAYGTLTDAANNTYSGLYAYCRPYKDINLGSTTQFTVALYGTMPTADNTILLDCGGCGSAGALLLASGSSANEAKLYYYNSSGLTPLATMAATSCRTTPHLYVFEKISDHQVNIYLDGKLALAYVNNDITFTLTAGFQVASGYAGVPSGLAAIAKTATTDTTLIAMTRIYDRIISDAEMAVLKTEWPYFSPNGDSARTLASGETAADWTETGKWTVNNASADTPLANSVVTLTNSAEADAIVSVNLDGNTEYESVTFAGDAAISVALKSGYTGKIVPASTSFETDTTVAYNAMSLTEGAVEVAAGKTLTFDVSSLVDANWANVASIASIQLTGVATLGTESSIAVTPTTSGYWNLAAEADAGGNYYLTFTPNRETGSIYWQSGTYWNSTYSSGDSPATFTTDAAGTTPTKYFAGDTVIIPNTTHRYFGPISDGAIIQFDCSGTIDISKTDSLGYALKNATVTVASGTTLNFVNSWNGASPEVYGGTISGAGKVKVESGKTLTLSNGATLASETALTGAGEVVLASVPTAQMTFDNWTGTVVLPAITSHVNLTLYGNSDSTIGITSLNTYLTSPYTEIDSTLRLDGAMTISAFSNRDYSFTKITGNGNLTFPNSNLPTAIAITELANYTGTLINNHESVGVDVTRVTKSVDVDGGALLLATNGVGEVSVSSFEVAGVAVSHYVAAGGFYRGAARYDGTVYKTFAEAIAAAGDANLGSITVLDGSATVPDGYCISGGNVAKAQAAIVDTEGTAHYYATPTAAAADIDSYLDLGTGNQKTYSYFAVYFGTDVEMSVNLGAMAWNVFDVKVKCLNDATVSVVPNSVEYEFSAEEPDVNGVVTYTKTEKATTYVWVGTGDSAQAWSNNNKWKVGTSDGDGASRAPGANDTVIINGGAPINISGVTVTAMHIGGEASIRGSGTLTATTGGIVLTAAGATLTVGEGVTVSAPTTTVAYSEIAYNEETRTYSVNKLAEASTESVDGVGEVEVIAPEEGVTSITVPAGTTGKVAIPGTVAQITGVTANDLLLKVEYNNGSAQTAYYGGILSVDSSGNVSLDGTKSVTVGEESIKVKPEIRTGADTEPMTLDGDTPGFTVKTIPGLYYSAETCSTPDGTFTSASTPQQATTASTIIETSGDMGEATVKYYRIKVSTTGND